MRRKKTSVLDSERECFPSNLRKLMEENSTSQEKLANAIGVTRQTISLYTTGQSSPDWKKLRSIANYFGVSADYLLGLTSVKTNNAELRHTCELTGLSVDTIESLAKIPDTQRLYFDKLLSILARSPISGYLENLYAAARVNSLSTWIIDGCSGAMIAESAPQYEFEGVEFINAAIELSKRIDCELLNDDSAPVQLSNIEKKFFPFYRNAQPTNKVIDDVELVIHELYRYEIRSIMDSALTKFENWATDSIATDEIEEYVYRIAGKNVGFIVKEATDGET